MKKSLIGLVGALALAACAGNDTGLEGATGSQGLELDNVNLPPTGVSLLVLAPTADRTRLQSALEKLQGNVIHSFGTRLAVATLPANAEAILTRLGVTAHYERSVDPTELSAATLDEQRFIRVFDSRYYPQATRAELAIRSLRVPRAPGEPFEIAPKEPPPAPTPAPELDRVTTPFASGNVVVSILLPESNGVIDPSTEDWTEDMIVETYQKVQAALEAFERTEPNAGLHFILHYESSPDHGGLPGTIDSDYEFGKHAQINDFDNEALVSAPLLARLLGHDVTKDQVWDASYEYLNKLRDQYKADGAYYIKVAANRNFTASLRAHAYINGPWTTLSTDYGFEVFMHETGHIFGALDEYCPDFCLSPSTTQGYLGMILANATSQAGVGGGINGGQGEDMPSLMQYNVAASVNGYTRGSWGWIDSDGDGLLEVRDTLPVSTLTAVVSGQNVRLQGTIEDRGASALYRDPRSFNRIVAVEYRAAGQASAPWMSAPVTAATVRGLATVDVDLGAFPAGSQSIEVRAVNSVGNVEPAPKTIAFTSTGRTNTAPRIRLTAPAVGSTRSAIVLGAQSVDFDKEAVTYRFDTDGDGKFETSFGTTASTTAHFASAGVYNAVVEARDARGLTSRATAEILVQDGNALPEVHFAPLPTPRVGADTIATTFQAQATDPDGDPIEYNWTAEMATDDQAFTVSSGFSAQNTSFPVSLQTPKSLLTTSVDLSGGQPLPRTDIAKIVAITPTILAAAAGRTGLLVTDVSNPAKPTLIAHLDLETEATDLVLDGKQLFVSGPRLLTLVDVSNPKRPVEVKQSTAARATRALTVADAMPVGDAGGDPAFASSWAAFGERVASTTVSVTIDHPKPAELTISLIDPTGAEIILRDRQAGAGGKKTYTFTKGTTPALSALEGTIASGNFIVKVLDNVTGNTGTLLGSTITLQTSSYAVPTITEPHLLGVQGGRYVVAAGVGFQVFDAQAKKSIKPLATLTGTGFYGGGLSGSTAIVLAPLVTKGPKGLTDADPAAAAPQLDTRGLYAVDVSNAKKPLVKHVDATIDGGQLFVAGSRFYLTTYPTERGATPAGPSTAIGSISAFASSATAPSSRWTLGTLPLVTHAGYGDDTTVYGLNDLGSVVRLDVSTPARARVVTSFFRPWVGAMAPTSANHAVFYDSTPNARLVDFNNVTSTISRVYRVTVDARDGHGVATASRALHVIPYDHAPSIDSLQVTAGTTTADDFTISLTAGDADRATTWDPALYARIDADGDGVFDGPWTQIPGAGTPATFPARFSTPGAHVVAFEVRDGFFGTAAKTLTVNVK